MSDNDLRAAVSAGVLGADEAHASLLRSIVEVARAIFRAQASSIMLFDEERDELVFEAVVGSGADTLVGRRFPASAGIAGWVLGGRQPLVIKDVGKDPRFARDVAESTGFVPEGLMAVPLLHEERAIGVLEVLDRPGASRFTLEEVDLLGLFGNQAAIALDLVQRGRRAKAALEEQGDEIAVVARIAAALDSLEGERRAAALRLLAGFDDLLGSD